MCVGGRYIAGPPEGVGCGGGIELVVVVRVRLACSRGLAWHPSQGFALRGGVGVGVLLDMGVGFFGEPCARRGMAVQGRLMPLPLP